MTEPTSGPEAPILQLRLYITGRSPNSILAIANAEALCDAHFSDRYELEVIDVLENAARALADGIIVTPTLMILLPPPVQRVIGNLGDTLRVLTTLGGV